MKPKLIEGQEIAITPLPLYHIFSLTVCSLALMRYGTQNVLIANPRDISGFIKEMKKYKFTVLTGVNTLFNALANHPKISEVDFSHTKVCVAGATALQQAVKENWKAKTNTNVIEGYGLTESSPVVCCNPVDGSDQVGTIGLPVPETDIKFIDDDGNEELIYVRNPRSYYKMMIAFRKFIIEFEQIINELNSDFFRFINEVKAHLETGGDINESIKYLDALKQFLDDKVLVRVFNIYGYFVDDKGNQIFIEELYKEGFLQSIIQNHKAIDIKNSRNYKNLLYRIYIGIVSFINSIEEIILSVEQKEDIQSENLKIRHKLILLKRIGVLDILRQQCENNNSKLAKLCELIFNSNQLPSIRKELSYIEQPAKSGKNGITENQIALKKLQKCLASIEINLAFPELE